jgi:hypothetical protein
MLQILCCFVFLMQGLAKQSGHIMTYTESQLISFGNFLLSRYGVMVTFTDGKSTPLYQREVGNWDMENWKDVTKPLPTDPLNYGDPCRVCFSPDSGGLNAFVVAVHDYGGQNKYDLELELDPNVRGKKTTRIYNVASAFVTPLFQAKN